MASREGYKLLEENEGSNDLISNSGSSAEPEAKDKNDARGLTESRPAVLQPSKDESRRSDGRPKSPLRKLFTRSCTQPSTQEVSISSSGESYSHKDEQHRSSEHQSGKEQQAYEHQTNCCATFMDCYNNYARIIGDSCFIYIFQLFIIFLCASAIIMGITFFRSCEGRYPSTDPLLTILMGISGLLLIYKWVAKVCRQSRGHHYWSHGKNRLIMYLVAVLFFMALEFMFFSQMSPNTLQSKGEVKCIKTYYNYLYYMHIANAGSLVLAALLYLPDCCIYIYTCQRLVPSHTNGHYQPV